MYHLPNELILQIWEYDSTYYNKYKNVIQELEKHFTNYNKNYFEYTRLYRRIIWSGNIRKSEILMSWFHKFGVNYDPGYYILNKDTNKQYNHKIKRGIRPLLVL